MDLMYYTSPPGLQFLHCLRNTVKGGTSIFVDSFRAATLLRLRSRQTFQALTTHPVQFHYLNDSRHYFFSRPTIVLDPSDPEGLNSVPRSHGFFVFFLFFLFIFSLFRFLFSFYSICLTSGMDIDHVNYAPPFQAPFQVDTTGKEKSNWRRFIQAFKGFAEICEREDMRFEHVPQEGECVVFANRRVLHARKAFDTDRGERWLKGTYVEWDDFQVCLQCTD